jgi:prepilin-type N-terminal cleavage/methylation domain-containing protein
MWLVGTRTRRRDDAGITLIEVIVATVILGILATSVLGLVLTAQKQSVNNRNRVAAANLAAREIEYVREQFMATTSGPLDVAGAGVVTDAHPLSGGVAGDPLVVDGTPYTVVRSVAWNPTGTGVSACEGGSLVSHPDLIVTVRVTWPGMGTIPPVTNSTVLAPPRGEGLSTTASFAAVSVTNAAGEPSDGRTVTVYSSGESQTGLTDPSGCAVIPLNPPASGAQYTAKFPDPGYVDITGTTSPERAIGLVQQGTLTSNVEISLDRAASVTIHLTGGVSAADAAGATVSLYQSEASGSSIIQKTLTGLDTTVTGLWPTDYSAFFGSTLPATMPSSVTLAPGGTGDLYVPFQYADFGVLGVPTVAGLPAFQIRAAAAGTPCTDPTAKLVDPTTGHLVAGTWSLWLYSAEIGCSEGPASVALEPGPNADVTWGTSTLRITGAPAGAAVWVSPAASGAACSPVNAIKVSDVGGTVGPFDLPAGDWNVFSAPDAGGPSTPCDSGGLVTVAYGTGSSFAWPVAIATINVSNVAWASNRSLLASATPVTSCTSTSNDGTNVQTFTTNGDGTFTGTVPPGTWYLYAWRQYVSTPTCFSTAINPLTVSGGVTYNVDFDGGSVSTP